MSIFTATKVGRIVKVTDGILYDKFVMIAKEFEEGYGVITEPSDWPTETPMEYNAIYVPKTFVTDISEEQETLLKIKFPNPDQFE